MAADDIDYEAIIQGGGLVGASLALALALNGRKICLLEARRPDFNQNILLDGWDSRIYAVNPVNKLFLENMRAWPDDIRVGPVRMMDVYGDRGGNIQFSVEGLDTEALAYIVENRYLLAKLWERLQEEGVTIRHTCSVALETTPLSVTVTLEDGERLGAKLLVGADGANSWVRERCCIPVKVTPYHHHGVVANFLCEKPHKNVAYQWFEKGGILAYLPMAEQHISIVWSTAHLEKLLSLDNDALAEQVAERGKHVLGQLKTVTDAQSFELRLIRPKHCIAERVVLVGDAAHTIHPLAGQGVNLGFGDVIQLSKLLQSVQDVGQWQFLRQHEINRLEAVRTMQFSCDALFKLFAEERIPLLPDLRNFGLSLTNKLWPLKKQLIKHAMGF